MGLPGDNALKYGRYDNNLKKQNYAMQFCQLMFFNVIKIALKIFANNSKQHLFRLWLGAVKEQALTWTKVDQDICRLMAHIWDNESADLFCWYRTHVEKDVYIFSWNTVDRLLSQVLPFHF